MLYKYYHKPIEKTPRYYRKLYITHTQYAYNKKKGSCTHPITQEIPLLEGILCQKNYFSS